MGMPSHTHGNESSTVQMTGSSLGGESSQFGLDVIFTACCIRNETTFTFVLFCDLPDIMALALPAVLST